MAFNLRTLLRGTPLNLGKYNHVENFGVSIAIMHQDIYDYLQGLEKQYKLPQTQVLGSMWTHCKIQGFYFQFKKAFDNYKSIFTVYHEMTEEWEEVFKTMDSEIDRMFKQRAVKAGKSKWELY